MLAPLIAVKTISWVAACGYAAIGASFTAGLIYIGNKISSALSPFQEEEVRRLEVERQNLTNVRLEQVALENQNLNLEAQNAITQNTNERENLAELNQDAKEIYAHTKIASKDLQYVAHNLRELSTQLDAKSKKIIVSLGKHLERIDQELQDANNSLETAAAIEAELRRLQNLCQSLEETIINLREQKNSEVQEIEEEKQALGRIAQQANEQALFFISENKVLKAENQRLLAVGNQEAVQNNNSQSNLRFFSR